jgi:hypothetical protein
MQEGFKSHIFLYADVQVWDFIKTHTNFVLVQAVAEMVNVVNVHKPNADGDETEARQHQDDMDERGVVLAGVVAHTLETLLNEAQNRHAVPTPAVSTLAQCLIDTANERDACKALSSQLRQVIEEIGQLRQQISADVKSIFGDITTAVRCPTATPDKIRKIRAMMNKINI